MTATLSRLGFIALLCATAVSVSAQTLNSPGEIKAPEPVPSESVVNGLSPVMSITPAIQILASFKKSDIKFDLRDLMETLRDRKHEGWVLAAYPDPKTGRPLIGAGFSLDLPAREHVQRDPLNPHPFLEPSSAELWQAAGLDLARLQRILDVYEGRLEMWNKKKFRKHIVTLAPDIRDEDADSLLQVSAIQAIYNAQAYCRGFDQLTASQQMAMSQLVYQMGVNLEEFSTFLSLINVEGGSPPAMADVEHWKTVQQSLMQSQWARLYRTRAVAVIAMLDPHYEESPAVAERRIGATLRPAVVRRKGGHGHAARQLASNSKRSGARKPSRKRSKRKA